MRYSAVFALLPHPASPYGIAAMHDDIDPAESR